MKRRVREVGTLAAVGALMLAGPLARAQMDFGTDMPVMDWITPYVDSQRFGDLLRSNSNPGRSGAPRKTTPAVTTTLAYTPTPALREATVDGYIARLASKNPAASQAVASNFGPGKYDYDTIFGGLVKPFGLRSNDAADALTAYLVLGYMIVNNVQDAGAVTPTMVRGVRTQFSPLLSHGAKLTAPGAAGQLGEELKLQTVVVQGGWQSAIREGTLSAYQGGISSQFKSQWGLDFAALKLTNMGFGPR